MVHEDSAEPVLIDFFVAAPGRDGIERRAELVPVPVHFDAETTQTFYVGPASCGVPGTAAGLERALGGFGSAALGDLVGPGVRLAREGAPVNAEQAYILDILTPIHARLEGTRELYAPGGRTAARGRRVPLPRAGRGARTLRRRRGRALLPRRGRGGAHRVRRRARRHPRAGGPRRLRGDRARPDPRPLPRHRGADQPAALLGRDPDRLLPGLLERMGESSGPEQLVAAMGAANDARGEEFAEALHGEAERAARPGLDARRPARLDHPHLGARRGRDVRERHLLERLRLRRARSRRGGDPQQHARRGGPQPARLPPDPGGAPGLLDDGADRRPPRRRDRARAGQRRLEPDPLGDPADDRQGGRAGDERRRGGAGAAAALRAGESSRPSRGSTRTRWPGSRRAACRSPAAPRSTYSSAACRPWRAIETAGTSAAGGTRAAAARWRRRDRLRGRGPARGRRGRGVRGAPGAARRARPRTAPRWRNCATRSPPDG